MLTRATGAFGRGVITLQKAFGVAAGLGLALLMVAQVFMRYVLEAPMIVIEEASVLLGEWIYFLGAAHVTWRDGHIRGGLANLIIRSERARLVVKAGSRSVCFVINLALAYCTLAYWIQVAESGRTSI
jgi:TRAP-type C4-dicarboxylate transport system permease small subunit